MLQIQPATAAETICCILDHLGMLMHLDNLQTGPCMCCHEDEGRGPDWSWCTRALAGSLVQHVLELPKVIHVQNLVAALRL